MGKQRAASCAELVLDVDTKTQRVVLKKKVPSSHVVLWLVILALTRLVLQEPGKRSQLWRMTGSGMLCHEGSSPPQSKPAQPRPLDSSLVLDIAGLAAVSDNRFVPFALTAAAAACGGTQADKTRLSPGLAVLNL